ncbi:Retrovirus-related Pol polyprotein type-2 like protein [Argiope bruennichi]|uniref:Retrovirus-related Pol polyprotein type-2 like protein n=1 Tax=Argiope bruennichi TaxID=94029 RepID=A0A8T0FDW6_ARGBR|nr:Retrovirus-related Pol polyprotein type-2 like protein [Argiope bruennichi]
MTKQQIIHQTGNKDDIKNLFRCYSGLCQDSRSDKGFLKETLSHIIQTCYSTHGARIQRHDAICKYLARVFGDRGCAVHEEPHFQTSLGVQKPDLVVYTPERVLVLDVQVINDQYPLELAHDTQVQKYHSSLRPHLEGLRPNYKVLSLTANWPGAL